jgi:hypothetical protein
MRALSSFILVMAALLLAGCESMEDRFSAVPPKVQVFNGDQSAVSVAAVQAFKRLDFQMTHSKGVDLEAVSRIHTSVAFADSRQLTAKVHVSDVGPGKSEVELSLTEQFQSERVGGTSQQTLRENSFFQLYFATLQQVLDDGIPAGPAKKN